LPIFVPNVSYLEVIPVLTTPGSPEAYYLCWNGPGRSGTGWKLAAFHHGEAVTPADDTAAGIAASRGTWRIRGMLPGSTLSVSAVRPPLFDNSRPSVSTFPETVTIPPDSEWCEIRPVTPDIAVLTAVAFDESQAAVLLGDLEGKLFSISTETIREIMEENGGDDPFAGEVQPSLYMPVLVPSAIRLDHLSACAVSRTGEVVMADGWENAFLFGPVEGTADRQEIAALPARAYFADAAFVDSPDTGGWDVILAEASGGRLFKVSPAASRAVLLHGVLPLDRTSGLAGANPPGRGPLAVASFDRELFLILRDPRSDEYSLWSSTVRDGEYSPARPREVVPVPSDAVVTGMTVAEVDGSPVVVVSADDSNGPLLLAKKLTEEHGDLLLARNIRLEPGRILRYGPFGCPDLEGARYTVVAGRLDRGGPCRAVFTFADSAGSVLTQGPYELEFGRLLVRSLSGVNEWFELAIEASGPESCLVRLEITGAGRGGSCFYREFPFIRGDTNLSGKVDIADAVSLLAYLFGGRELSACHDAADVNDDGAVAITDPVALLGTIFAGKDWIARPYPECGFDPTADSLPSCRSNSGCAGGSYTSP